MRSAGVDEVLEPASLRPEVRLNEAPPVIGSLAQMLLTGSENGFQAAGPVEHCVDPCRDIPGIGRVAPSHEVSQDNDQLSHVPAPFPVPGLLRAPYWKRRGDCIDRSMRCRSRMSRGQRRGFIELPVARIAGKPARVRDAPMRGSTDTLTIISAQNP